MGHATGRQATDGRGSRDGPAGWRQWLAQWRRVLRPEADEAHALATTLPAPGRGRALRAAHRALKRHLRSHPAMQQLLPHLWAIERALARRGSLALMRLPLPVLERGLRQLALLQRDDDPPEDAHDLRVLRLRLIEAIELRRPLAGDDGADGAPGSRFLATQVSVPAPSGFGASSALDSSAFASLPGVEVSELPMGHFDGDAAHAPARQPGAAAGPRPR